MSIENLLTELNTNIVALTAALKGAGAAASTGKAESSAKTTAAADKKTTTGKKDTKPKVTLEQVKTALVKVKDEVDSATAKKIITEVGEVKQMADIQEENFQAVLDACEKALSGETDEDDSGDGL